MKAFHFPLQAVLTVRENQENKALEAFGLAQAHLQRALLRQASARQSLDEAFTQRKEFHARIVRSDELQQLQQGFKVLQKRIRESDVDVEKAKAQTVARSRELLHARKQREVIESVFEKQLARHRAEQTRAEQKVLDDIAALKSIGNFAFRWK